MHTATATEEPASDRVVAALDRRAGDGTLEVVAGGTALYVAGRFATDSPLGRALAVVVGAGLIGYGVDKRVGRTESPRGAETRASGEPDWHSSRGETATTPARPRTGREPSTEDATDARPASDDRVGPESRRSADDSGTSIDIASPGATTGEPGDATGPDPTRTESTRVDGRDRADDPEATKLADDHDTEGDDRNVDSDTPSDRDDTASDDEEPATEGE